MDPKPVPRRTNTSAAAGTDAFRQAGPHPTGRVVPPIQDPTDPSPDSGGGSFDEPDAVWFGKLTLLLQAIARSAHADIGAADGVGVTLLVEGRPVFAGSNDFTAAVDHIQYVLGQGPCIAAVDNDQVVRSDSIGAGEHRWGPFTPRAATLRLRSVASTPVHSDADVVGSLNLYGRRRESLDVCSDDVLHRQAETVARLLAPAWLMTVSQTSAHALEQALRDRAAVAVAVGVLIARYRTTADEARRLLRTMADRARAGEVSMARLLVDDEQQQQRMNSPVERPKHG